MNCACVINQFSEKLVWSLGLRGHNKSVCSLIYGDGLKPILG
jgi:hypothetical protein